MRAEIAARAIDTDNQPSRHPGSSKQHRQRQAAFEAGRTNQLSRGIHAPDQAIGRIGSLTAMRGRSRG